jgi:hypothetical protein
MFLPLCVEFSIKKRDSLGTREVRLTCTRTKPKRPFRSLQFAPALSGWAPDPAPPLRKAKLAATALLVWRLRCSGWRHGVGRLRRYGRAPRSLRQSGGGKTQVQIRMPWASACWVLAGDRQLGCSRVLVRSRTHASVHIGSRAKKYPGRDTRRVQVAHNWLLPDEGMRGQGRPARLYDL